MHQINLIDETFDKNQAHHYNLAIQFGLNGLSYCLFDTIKNKYVAFRYYPETESSMDKLQSLFASDELLTLPFKDFFLLYTAGQSTLVPLPYFDESKIAELYAFNFGAEDNTKFLFNKLQDCLAVNLFSCAHHVTDELKKLFPSLKIYHRTSPFLENLVQESARWPRIKCFVSIHQNILDIGFAHLRRLDFFNSFAYRDKSDIVYHVLNVLEQFNLSPALTDVYLSVDLEKHEEIYEFLGTYLTHIKFIKPSENFTYSYIFDDFQLTRFANLFNLALCVS